MTNKVNLVLNGKHISVDADETILQVANRFDISIPTLCFDERLKPNSSCFVCVVEVEQNGRKSMQPSCSTLVSEGMKIDTSNAAVQKSRKTALELLLSNHYADCVAPCTETCPAGVDVQGYISLIEKGRYNEAVALIKETNPLPAICGRVCVRPCEMACRRNLLNESAPVGIDYLKRFAADFDLKSDVYIKPAIEATTGKKIAIIGAGPGGLSAAWFLQQKGHQCDIFEAQPYAGGWLRYGIPEYRLPNDIIDREVNRIIELGTQIFYNQRLGENLSYETIVRDYDATILTIGSQRGTLLHAEGDDAENVFSGIDFLRNMEVTGQRYDFKNKKIAVVGGGNTAMDCCRTAIRCGSKNVKVIYRRTENEMPANPIEIHESKLEGVKYDLLTNPIRVNKDANGRVKSMTLIKMELGEPDSSGRRRPQPVDGSEYEEEFDYILAAIGQKTEINFLENINQFSKKGQLKPNKWGDIDANPDTLQTGIESVFAAGDGVTGPATIIEAIAQSKIAAHSCDLFLRGMSVMPEPKAFFSRKSNFKKQISDDYVGRYQQQLREEMPTLPKENRLNFNEVELGYASEQVAVNEANRCLECGCDALYTCDLRKYSSEYQANQNNFSGEYIDLPVDHSHPYIEIDNNKCILCTRCVRICRDVVGANALGLVNRGFETIVAPEMGKSLLDTQCESCGMCISACPTGAISENYRAKSLPVQLDTIHTICNYCSIGCEIDIHHKNGYVNSVSGHKGLINKDGNICKFPRFGYDYLNDQSRIKNPLIKENGAFREATFSEAYDIIFQKFSQSNAHENAVFGGARLSNEELFLLRKLTIEGLKTNNIGSFHYLGREYGCTNISQFNVPFEQLEKVNKIVLLGSELNNENAVLGFMIQHAAVERNIPITNISDKAHSSMDFKVSENIKVESYYHLIKAMNYYLLSNELQNSMFIDSRCDNFDSYRTQLLKFDFSALCVAAGLKESTIACLADDYNLEANAVLIFAEKNLDEATIREIFNLSLITGKLGKSSMGLIALREKNNSQGLIDMRMISSLQIGSKTIEESVCGIMNDVLEGNYKNVMIWGEDPVGTAKSRLTIHKFIDNVDFLVVQDAFLTETAAHADVVLPAPFTPETKGTFTNTSKYINKTMDCLPPVIQHDTLEQIAALLSKFGVQSSANPDELFSEFIEMLPNQSPEKHRFVSTMKEGQKALFEHGADYINKKFSDEFHKRMTQYEKLYFGATAPK